MTYRARYFIYGVIFGCCFPVFASIFDVIMQGLPLDMDSIMQVQRIQPLHWVIDSAPLFLGVFAGIKQDKVQQRTAALTEEIAERTRAEQKVKRLNRIYAVLSGINTTIVRTHGRQELFAEACRIAVEHGQFRMAWIGLLDPSGVNITPVARAGFDDGYLDQMRLITRDDVPDSYPLVAQVLRENVPIICNDIGTDPQMARWREEALRRGYCSLVVFPLVVEDKAVGLLALYATETGFFDSQEMKLLVDLASNLSFALDYLEKRDRLNYLANYDSLTGLPSRPLLLDRLNQELAHRPVSAFALLFVGIDHFKKINDSLGHNSGDQLLKQLAIRFADSLREGDTVAHLGGDEFVWIMVNMPSEEDASVLAQKILKLGAEPFIIDGRELFVTCSIGIALSTNDGKDAETLMMNASAALYRAKDQGHNNAQFCTAEMNAKALQRLTLESKLRHALEHSEFQVHYQPKLSLANGQVVGAEALVRWLHPEMGMISPADFIPLAEETGLIVPLGEWVLNNACQQMRRWLDAGLAVPPVAVNLSARQFRQENLVQMVRQALHTHQLEAKLLALEITESAAMHDVEQTISILHELKAIGIKLSLDDFGTGYSSLSYLKRFPIDQLKIDKAFVNDIITNPDDAAICIAIIGIAHNLKMTVIAEGVETEDQMNFLRQQRCDEMQGYYFSRPLPAVEYAQLLAAGRGLALREVP